MASKIIISLDTSKENYILTKCKQDDDLTLEAFIYENGISLDLSNKEIFIKALKSDGTYINQSTGITKENNKMLADLIRDFSRVPGATKIEILLVEGGKNNTTFSFYLEVVGSVIKGAVESKDTVTILEELDKKVLEAGQVKAETEQLIATGGAATKGDIATVNSSLEQITNYITPEMFGAKGDGIIDDTTPIINALIKAKNLKKPVLLENKYAISKPIMMFEGLNIKGVNCNYSKLIRHPNFINEGNISLLLNEGWDSQGVYSASGNITITDLGFVENEKDSCINIGHAENVKIERCKFENIYYHATDLVACKNVIVRDCIVDNSMNLDGAFSGIQIDKAILNAITGVFIDNTSCDNVLIENNIIKGCNKRVNETPQSGAIHIHHDGHKNININNNIIYDADFSIKGDEDFKENEKLENIKITNNNFYKGNNSVTKGVYLPCKVESLVITGNTFTTMNVGIQVSSQSVNDFCGNVIIADNIFVNCVNNSILVEQCYHLSISNNISKTLGGSTSTVGGAFVILGCRYFKVNNNMVYNSTAEGILIKGSKYNTNSSNSTVNDNSIKGCSIGINCSTTPYSTDIIFVGNTFNGNTTDKKIIGTRLKDYSNIIILETTKSQAEVVVQPNTLFKTYLSFTGVTIGKYIQLSYTSTMDGLVYNAFVTSTNNVEIQVYNPTIQAITIPTGTWSLLYQTT